MSSARWNNCPDHNFYLQGLPGVSLAWTDIFKLHGRTGRAGPLSQSSAWAWACTKEEWSCKRWKVGASPNRNWYQYHWTVISFALPPLSCISWFPNPMVFHKPWRRGQGLEISSTEAGLRIQPCDFALKTAQLIDLLENLPSSSAAWRRGTGIYSSTRIHAHAMRQWAADTAHR